MHHACPVRVHRMSGEEEANCERHHGECSGADKIDSRVHPIAPSRPFGPPEHPARSLGRSEASLDSRVHAPLPIDDGIDSVESRPGNLMPTAGKEHWL
jgi:hypothetical protein